MGAETLTPETIVLLFRFALLLALYLFLWQVIAVVWRDLQSRAPKEAAPEGPQARLVVLTGGATPLLPGHSFPLAGSVTLGRGPDNTIVLSDSFVSTNHARLEARDDRWWLADLGSRNGTLLNGQRVDGEVPVKRGDVVTIGPVTLKLET